MLFHKGYICGLQTGCKYVTHLIVVVTQGSAQLIIVHVGLVLAQPPKLSHLFGLQQLELAIIGRPADEVLVTLVEQQLQQELPECDRALHDGRRPRDRADLQEQIKEVIQIRQVPEVVRTTELHNIQVSAEKKSILFHLDD